MVDVDTEGRSYSSGGSRSWNEVVASRAGGTVYSLATKEIANQLQDSRAKAVGQSPKQAQVQLTPFVAELQGKLRTKLYRRQALQEGSLFNTRFSFGVGERARSVSPIAPKRTALDRLITPMTIAEISQLDVYESSLAKRVDPPTNAYLLQRVSQAVTSSTEIDVGRDLSAATRHMTNLKTREEQRLVLNNLKETEAPRLSLLQECQEALRPIEEFDRRRIKWRNASDFVLGRFPRLKLSQVVRPNQPPAPKARISKAKQTIVTVDTAPPPESTLSSIEIPTVSQSSLIEDQLHDIIEQLRSENPEIPNESIDHQVEEAAALTESVHNRGELNQQDRLRAKLLFQFVKEYRKLKRKAAKPAKIVTSSRKPPVPRFENTVRRGTTDELAELGRLTPPKTKRHYMQATANSLRRMKPLDTANTPERTKKWIGAEQITQEFSSSSDGEEPPHARTLTSVPSFGDRSSFFGGSMAVQSTQSYRFTKPE